MARGDDQRIGKKWGFLILIGAVQTVMMIGTTVVMVSLPALRESFQLTVAQLQWVVTSYNLGFGGLILVGGRLADILGQRRMLITGLSVFLASSLVAGFAGDELVLVLARGAQGLGAAFASPAALSLLTSTFVSPRARGVALGVWAACGASGAALGNVIGGLATALAGWRSVFFLNVPVSVVLLLLVVVVVQRTSTRAARGGNVFGRLKLGSGLLITSGIAFLIYALAELPQQGIASAQVWVSVAAAILIGTLFVIIQHRSHDPMLNLSILRNRTGIGFLLIVLAAGVGVGPYYVASLFMQEVLGISSIIAGLMFVPWCLMIIVGAQIAARALPRFGARATLTAGFVISAVGTSVLAIMASESMSFVGGLLETFVLVGLGGGVVGVTATTVAMSEVPVRFSGIAAGVANFSQQMGGALSIAVVALIVTLQVGGSGPPDAPAVKAGLWCATGIAGLGLLLAAVFSPGRKRGA